MNIVQRLTRERYHEFLNEYYHTVIDQELRIGQAFLNRFFNDAADPELFYETDDMKAIELIEQHYVESLQKVA